MKGRTRLWLNLAAGVVVAMATQVISAPPAVAEEQGCCYSDCMDHCTPQFGFAPCHKICDRDCEAC